MFTYCTTQVRAQELCESGGGRPGLPVPNSRKYDVHSPLHVSVTTAHGLRGRHVSKATVNCSQLVTTTRLILH